MLSEVYREPLRQHGSKIQGSELWVCAQHVVFIWAILLRSRACILPKPCWDLIERPTLSFRHLEVCEDEENEQQHSEDDEDVRACQLLNKTTKEMVSSEASNIKYKHKETAYMNNSVHFSIPPHMGSSFLLWNWPSSWRNRPQPWQQVWGLD